MNIKKEFIFETDKYFNACHASTLLKLNDGSILAAWFAGTREGNDDVRIWYAKKCGEKWNEPKMLKTDKDLPHWNPVLYIKNDGTIRLFYKTGKKISHWVTEYCDSSDGGETWSKPVHLVKNDCSGGRGPVKNKCLRTSDGLLLAPASTEQNKQLWRCFIDISEDDGNTWSKQNYIVRPKKLPTGLVNMIQPTLWEDNDGIIHALMRTNKGYIYHSCSNDGGKKWTKAEKTDIPNNNSGIDCVKASDSNIYLVCNPVTENWGTRSPLSLMESENNGKSFSAVAVLEDRADGEFSYPAIIADNNKLHITYTYERKNIVYCEIEI